MARVDNGGGSSLRSASSRRSGFGTLYQSPTYISANLYRPLVRLPSPPYGSTIFFSPLEKFPPVWIESTFGVVCYSSSVLYIWCVCVCVLLLAASFSFFFPLLLLLQRGRIVSTIYAYSRRLVRSCSSNRVKKYYEYYSMYR